MRLPSAAHLSIRLILARSAFVALAGFSVPAQAQFAASADVSVPVAGSWSSTAARDLLAAIDDSAREGLDPSAYDPATLRRAIADGEGVALDAAANATALSLARDYFSGRIADKAAFDWHIERSAYEAAKLPAQLQVAVAANEVGKWLRELLPQNDQYRALRAALADAPDAASRDRIRANLERWRWMPRTLGQDYLYVNVPSYQLKVVEDGAPVSTYAVVVGAVKTPTPMLALTAASVVVNPWWNVPESIAKQGLGRGYQAVRTADGGVRYRQAPGPRNALGKIKIDMPNEHAIYLHDTPSKGGFAKAERALSHGCIRVQDIDRLAAEIMTRDEAKAKLEQAIATTDTTTLPLQTRWPVYLVYFTAEADGGAVKLLSDPYGRDAQLAAKLDASTMMARRTAPVRLASSR